MHGIEERIVYDWSHMVTLFFRRHGKDCMRTSVSNPPIKKYKKQNTFNQNSSEERVPRKYHSSQTLLTLGHFGRKYCRRLNSGELEKLSL